MFKCIFVAILVIATTVYAEKRIAKILLSPDPKFINNNVTGILTLSQDEENGLVSIIGIIEHLKPSAKHGFHVHAKGDITEGCISAGSHFNPEKVTHGAPNDTTRHVGDLGNIEADSSGTAHISISDNIISLSGKNSIIGRSIVVHSLPDDLGKGGNNASLETGNAGDRWACGVIGIL